MPTTMSNAVRILSQGSTIVSFESAMLDVVSVATAK